VIGASAEQQPVGKLPAFERPIRIPKQVPLERAKPPFARAGETSSWRVSLKLARAVRPGQPLRLELWGGRNNKGGFRPAQVTKPSADGYVTARTADGRPLLLKPVEAKGRSAGGTFAVSVPKTGLAAGAIVQVILGDTSKGGRGIQASSTRMLNKFIVLYCPPAGEAPKRGGARWGPAAQRQIVAACLIHILGDTLDHLRAYVPSQCKPGDDVDILVRPEDKHSNLSHQTLEGLDVFLGQRRLEATVQPVEDSTCVRARVKLPSEGVHRFRVVERRTGKTCLTNPIACRADTPEYNVYWGMLHGHTEMSDGWGTIDYYFRQMRDEAGLDFAASSDHDHLWETPDAYWKIITQTVKRYHAPGRFVTILGYEWAKWRRNGDGDRNVYYLEDDQPLYRSDEGHSPRPPDLFCALGDKKAIVIPHHPGGDGNHCDYKDHDPTHERLVEIHQVRGCYECSVDDGNPLIARADTPNGKLVAEGFVQRALALGWRIGFTAGGDDHRGTAGTDKPVRLQDGTPIYAGSMCVLAKGKTRPAIYDALWHRRVVATSGPRVLLQFDVDGHRIGSEVKASAHPELARRRTVHVAFHGTAPVRRIDVIRNNKVVFTTKTGAFAWTDETPLAEAAMPAAKFCPHPFCFYYVRVVQTDGQAAWASPIWIDP